MSVEEQHLSRRALRVSIYPFLWRREQDNIEREDDRTENFKAQYE